MEWIVKTASKISGEIVVPPDKSITHRAIMIGSLCEGESIVYNYLASEDCMNTLNAMTGMGIKIEKAKTSLKISGAGLKGLRKPALAIDSGNSGTTARLLSGILAGQAFCAEITGDESLSKRPMKRIIEPLRLMGASVNAREDNYLPMQIEGNPFLKPISFSLNVASAQVKSCILFAGLHANGTTIIKEPIKSRDHTERMLKALGADINIDGLSIEMKGPCRLNPFQMKIPGDISSAAFFLVAASVLNDSRLTIMNVGMNETRDGILEILKKMGADISALSSSRVSGEPVGDIEIKSSRLKAVEIDEQIIPRLIDEIPVLVLAATQAEGRTVISGAGELRVKESDRIKTISKELLKMGAKIQEKADGLIIDGPSRLSGAEVESHGDHRIAMTLAIAGLIADGQTRIDNIDCVSTSFPGFWELLNSLI